MPVRDITPDSGSHARCTGRLEYRRNIAEPSRPPTADLAGTENAPSAQCASAKSTVRLGSQRGANSAMSSMVAPSIATVVAMVK